MNLPTTLEAVIIIVIVVLPGFVFTQVARRAIAHTAEDVDYRHLLWITAIGLALHAGPFPLWTHRVVDLYLDRQLDLSGMEVWIWAVTAVYLFPALAGIVVGLLVPTAPVDWLLDKIGRGWIDRLPSAWDYAVRLGPAWVKLYLKDGSVIGGIYANASLASIRSTNRDIFIEQVYNLDENGYIGEPVEDSLGMWISADALVRIEFLYGGVANGDENATSQDSEI